LTDVTLIYPYRRKRLDRSIFLSPPLGLGYLASYLRRHAIDVAILDCTFLTTQEVLNRVQQLDSPIIGIYCMYTMEEAARPLAQQLQGTCDLLVAGGPLPTLEPETFLQDFDVVVLGEGERTLLDVHASWTTGGELGAVQGIAYTDRNVEHASGRVAYTPPRSLIEDLDAIPRPARDLFDNAVYQRYFRNTHGYTMTSLITSRGCPYHYEFCSKPVFGDTYRSRSAVNVVDEIEDALAFGYERLFFQDDCFTLDAQRVFQPIIINSWKTVYVDCRPITST
jgi:radical SAM superfamily enzyme YgiQ (UPF0313 family)